MADIKPIETYYNGYRFRSRLEARWAVFFDALGIKYEYEPEGFDLGNGLYYLPDFLLHDIIPRYKQGDAFKDVYVEVKGKPNAKDAEKISAFSQSFPIWVVGEIPDPDDYVNSCEKQRDEYCNKVCNGEYDFPHHCVFCPYDHGPIDHDSCFAFSLGYDYGTLSFHGADSSYAYGAYYQKIEDALRKARQARFEHGEKPNKALKAIRKCPLHEFVFSCEGCRHEHNEKCDFGVEIGWNGDFAVGLCPNYQ